MFASLIGSMLAAAAASAAPGLAPPLIQERRAEPPPLEAKARPVPNLVVVDGEAPGVTIAGIKFAGVQAPQRVADAARAFLGKPATAANLQALASAISDAYAKTDVALYTVAIPRQDFAGGTVRVLLAEGFVESVAYPTNAIALVRAYGERLRNERPLTRRTLERYVSLLRDIPGATVDVGIDRGKAAGAVVVSLKTRRKTHTASLGISNGGIAGLSRGQFQAQASLFSALRDGDRTDVSALSSLDFKRFQYVAASHQTPLGSNGLTLALSGSALRTRSAGVTGTAWTAGLTASYPIIRSYRRNLTASGGLDLLNSDAALVSAVLSSDRVRTARAGLGYGESTARRSISASLAVAHGLGLLGARTTPGEAETRFAKVSGQLGLDQAIGPKVVVRVRTAGQYSRDRLSPSERFAVGGTDYGRAFDYAVLAGDSGLAGSLELAARPLKTGPAAASEVYGFIDGARVHLNLRPLAPAATYGLASAGAGVRLAYTEHAALSLEAARAIDQPLPSSRDRWRFNIGWTLKFNP